MDTIKTLVIEPLRRPELRDIDPTITAIGETIGGYAEPLPLDRRTTLWCDEEGAIKNLKPNRTIRLSQDSRLADAGKPIIIRGTFVITGPHPQDGPLGLDDEQIGRYAAMFADPRPRSPRPRQPGGRGRPPAAGKGHAPLPDLPAPARAAGPDRHRFPAHMRETRWTGKPYQKKERPQRGAAPGFPFRPFRLKPKRSYRRRGTRQIATQRAAPGAIAQ